MEYGVSGRTLVITALVGGALTGLGVAFALALFEAGVDEESALVDVAMAGVVLGFLMLFWSLLAWMAPRERRARRRKALAAETARSPLPPEALTHRALAEAASGLAAAEQPPAQPEPMGAPTDAPKVRWWRTDLLLALGVYQFMACATLATGAAVMYLLRRADGLAIALVFLLAAVFCCVKGVRQALLARHFARIASGPESRPMRYVVLRAPQDRAERLVLFPPGDDPDAAPEAVLRPARKQQVTGLPPVGVADVHAAAKAGFSVAPATEGWPVTILVPWIDGTPVWSDEPTFLVDVSRDRDRGLLTQLANGVRRPS
jgi:hypothetical protein